MTQIALALVIGGLFGFTLDRIGATNPNYIIRMLNFSNLHLMKTILGGIGVGSILMFGGLILGLVDPGHISIKAAYLGVLLGGILLGVGFAVSGYCPGTGLTAFATGRIDAFFFIIGGLVGAAAYMGSYSWVTTTGILDNIAGGKASLGSINGTDYPAMLSMLDGEWLGVLLGVVFIGIAWLLPGTSETPRERAHDKEVKLANRLNQIFRQIGWYSIAIWINADNGGCGKTEYRQETLKWNATLQDLVAFDFFQELACECPQRRPVGQLMILGCINRASFCI